MNPIRLFEPIWDSTEPGQLQFCCKDCIKTFEKDQAKFLKKVAEQAATAKAAPATPAAPAAPAK
jgi:hypothetical protein